MLSFILSLHEVYRGRMFSFLLLHRMIVKRRRNLEYRLLRRPAKKQDFLRAIQVTHPSLQYDMSSVDCHSSFLNSLRLTWIYWEDIGRRYHSEASMVTGGLVTRLLPPSFVPAEKLGDEARSLDGLYCCYVYLCYSFRNWELSPFEMMLSMVFRTGYTPFFKWV